MDVRGYLAQTAGQPYRFGQIGPSGFDCDGLVEAWVALLRANGQPAPVVLGPDEPATEGVIYYRRHDETPPPFPGS